MREDGAALLGEAGHVDHAAALAFQMGRHAEDRADGHNAGAADAGDDHAVIPVEHGHGRLGQGCVAERAGFGPGGSSLFRLRALHGDEGGAEAGGAGEILVAVRLVDLTLSAELGLQRLHRDAIGLHAAVAAALADQLVDDDALVGIGVVAALAAAALLGRAGLVVEQERDALDLGELALHGLQILAVMEARAGRPGDPARILVRLVRHHGDARHAFGGDLLRHLPGLQAPFGRLPAGHGHGVVVEQLVGDVDPGRDRPADRERAGMGVGAVAQVLEDMAPLREGRLADPVRAFAAHLGEAVGLPVHPLHHIVAADAGVGAHAFGNLGGGIVRAAGAEIGRAPRVLLRLADLPLEGAQRLEPRGDAGVVAARQDALAQRDADLVRVERAMDGEEPFAPLVLLADHHGLVLRAVKLLAHLHLDQGPLLLDHHDEFEPPRELLQFVAADRPGAADLEQADAQIVGLDLVNSQLVQRLADVEIGLAHRDDADARRGPARGHHLVQAVGLDVGQDRRALVDVEALLLIEEVVRAADVQPARRHLEGGNDHFHPVEGGVDGGGRLDVVLHAFQADPDAGEAGQGDGVDAVIEDLLHAGRVQHRHHAVDEDELGLVGVGGAFRGVVVAHQGDHAAMLRRAGHVGVTEHVAGPVDAGALAVPEGEDAVMLALAADLGLLGAPYGRGGEVLVEAGLKQDVGGLELLSGAQQLRVEAAQRRAAVAGDETRRVEAGGLVAPLLVQQKAGDGLRSGHEGAGLGQIILVVERHLEERPRGRAPREGHGGCVRHRSASLWSLPALAHKLHHGAPFARQL